MKNPSKEYSEGIREGILLAAVMLRERDFNDAAKYLEDFQGLTDKILKDIENIDSLCYISRKSFRLM